MRSCQSRPLSVPRGCQGSIFTPGRMTAAGRNGSQHTRPVARTCHTGALRRWEGGAAGAISSRRRGAFRSLCQHKQIAALAHVRRGESTSFLCMSNRHWGTPRGAAFCRTHSEGLRSPPAIRCAGRAGFMGHRRFRVVPDMRVVAHTDIQRETIHDKAETDVVSSGPPRARECVLEPTPCLSAVFFDVTSRIGMLGGDVFSQDDGWRCRCGMPRHGRVKDELPRWSIYKHTHEASFERGFQRRQKGKFMRRYLVLCRREVQVSCRFRTIHRGAII